MTALYRNSFLDFIARILSLIGLSFPAFYSAILLIWLFHCIGNGFPSSVAPTCLIRSATAPPGSSGLQPRIDRGGLCDQGDPFFHAGCPARTTYMQQRQGLPGMVILFRHACGMP